MFTFCLIVFIATIIFFTIAIINNSNNTESKYYSNDDWNESGSGIISIILAIVLAISLISIPITRVCISDEIVAFKVTQATVSSQRIVSNEYESALLTKEIIHLNRSLARYQNQNVWYRLDWWIPDVVMELTIIE